MIAGTGEESRSELFPNELHNRSQAGVKLAFHDFTLDFLTKKDLTIWELVLDVFNGHQQIRIFGASSAP